jgi:hypothetical protein
MEWNAEKQTRLTELRRRELAGRLAEEEKTELADIMAEIEQQEAHYLIPAVEKMRLEQTMLEARLQNLHTDNEALAKLLNQQEQLATEARRWLADFEKRHLRIQQTYTRLTGEPLTPT